LVDCVSLNFQKTKVLAGLNDREINVLAETIARKVVEIITQATEPTVDE